MPVLVSALRQTSPERVTIVLDDGTEIKATLGVVAEHRLYTGRMLEERELQELRSSASLALAKTKGLELLSYRPMSVRELRDKLVQKGESPESAEAAAAWLVRQNLLNDERYAAMICRHYTAKGYGPARIRQELSRRGIARELWEEALSETADGAETLDKLVESRLKDPTDRAQVQKLSAALYRRGFSWEEIRDALARFQARLD